MSLARRLATNVKPCVVPVASVTGFACGCKLLAKCASSCIYPRSPVVTGKAGVGWMSSRQISVLFRVPTASIKQKYLRTQSPGRAKRLLSPQVCQITDQLLVYPGEQLSKKNYRTDVK